MTTITARTRPVVLLGDPVAHSLSPTIQNEAFMVAGVDGIYFALRCDEQAFPGLLRGIALGGGAGNVTVPHKERAAALLDAPTSAVSRTGACNTFWSENGRICGDNTDVAGFDAAVRRLIGSPAGARVLIAGAGGAARAALCALIDAHVDAVTLWARSPERAAALRDAFDPHGRRVRVAQGPQAVHREGFDLVVNATPLGLQPGDPAPIDLQRLRRASAVLDLVYAPGETEWVRSARALGLRAADGRYMLLHQGAAAFERWWGRPAPIEAMTAALEAAAAAR